jgi:hypothetical protein
MLQNRIYRGEIVHKERSYPGEHAPIIDRELWEMVQARLAGNVAQRDAGGRTAQPSLPAGRRVTPRKPSASATGAALPPLACRPHVYLARAAARAHKPTAPLEHARLGAVAGGHLGRIGLDPVAALAAPHDEANASRGGAAERHWWAKLGFHLRRRLPRISRGGAYTFGGGKDSRTGSGLRFPRIALRVRMRGENG